MISELSFAREYASFWRLTTPTMEGFVRRLNRGGLEGLFPPMKAEIDPRRRAFLNEVSFSVFCNYVQSRPNKGPFQLEEAIDNAIRINSDHKDSRGNDDSDYAPRLTQEESNDIGEQVRRLAIRFHAVDKSAALTCNPQLSGCGIVDACQGDILKDKTLFEIEAGDRPIRSIDLRQIITYLALNHAKPRYDIEHIGLFNPRVGADLEMSVIDLCFAVSGRDVSRLMEEIIRGMSAGDISR